MENVKGMLSVANQVVEDYNNIKVERNGTTYSYNVAYKLLNSADFSVAQSRERLIYIAIRTDISESKGITPEDIFEQIEEANKGHKTYVLKDALDYIKPLDAPRVKNMNEVDDEKTGKKIDVNNYLGNENDYLKLINGNREIPFLYNHKARFVNDINYDIYRLLNQGDDASDPKIADIMPYTNRLHCFKDKYYKLRADYPSRTITAHMRNTLVADKTSNREEALIAIYDLVRPGERPTLEAAINLFLRQGFDPAYYDLSAVGRFKMNKRLKIDSEKYLL